MSRRPRLLLARIDCIHYNSVPAEGSITINFDQGHEILRTILCVAILCLASVTQADDWPQWMGPKRDNVWRETGLVESLPSQPKIVWRAPVAGGYSGPAVTGGKGY